MAPTTEAERIIAALRLEPLPGEGGFFRQTWRSPTASTIVFLLTTRDFSALHRLQQDETWHYYAGDCVEHVQIDPRDGSLHVARMGPNVLAGQQPQVHVRAENWQGARLAVAISSGSSPPPVSDLSDTAGAVGRLHGFALLGCTVSPPWDERGFTLGIRSELTRQFPKYTDWTTALTRPL
jgi:uncharacterized protein